MNDLYVQGCILFIKQEKMILKSKFELIPNFLLVSQINHSNLSKIIFN